MSLPKDLREKWCYGRCEELIPQVKQLGRELESIEKKHDVCAENTGKIVDQLREIQSKLAAIALKEE